MNDFFIYFFLVVFGSMVGGSVAGLFIIQLYKRNFHKPKLYFKDVQILPAKGDILENTITWGGIVLTADICNDSEYWAYNVRIEDIYAEFSPNSKPVLLGKVQLKLATDLPQNIEGKVHGLDGQLHNLGPKSKMTTSIRILTRKEVSLDDYKNLIKELRMIQIKARLLYDNSHGQIAKTYFWLDFRNVNFVNSFKSSSTVKLKRRNKGKQNRSEIKIRNKTFDLHTESI